MLLLSKVVKVLKVYEILVHFLMYIYNNKEAMAVKNGPNFSCVS